MQLAQSELSRYMREIQHHPVLSPEEEQRLAIRYYESQDIEAARALVLANLRFALKVAMEYSRYAPVMDLVQEANLGLMEAVRRFNPYRGYRLITYAVWWIRAYIQKFIVESTSVVRRGTTRDQRKVARKLGVTRRALEQASGTEASVAELALALDVTEESVASMLQKSDLSFDVPLAGDESGATLLDFLADQSQSVEERLLSDEQQALLQRALAEVTQKLNERERQIVDARILATEPLTLQELADQMQVSRERIRQIEDAVRAKIATSFKAMLALPPAAKALPPANHKSQQQAPLPSRTKNGNSESSENSVTNKRPLVKKTKKLTKRGG